MRPGAGFWSAKAEIIRSENRSVCCLQTETEMISLWQHTFLLILCITLCISAKKGNECPHFLNKEGNYLTYETNYCIKVQWRIIPEIILEEMGQNE